MRTAVYRAWDQVGPDSGQHTAAMKKAREILTEALHRPKEVENND